jgi:hypothetical protein
MSTVMLNTGVVHLPVFQILRDDFVLALDGAARATSASTGDIGDYFNMALASKVPIAQVADNATVLVPLFNIENGAIANASILATDPMLYARLQGHPQPLSSGVESQMLPIEIYTSYSPMVWCWSRWRLRTEDGGRGKRPERTVC